MTGSLQPIEYTSYADGVQYVSFRISLDGRWFIARKTRTESGGVVFGYSNAYEQISDYPLYWGQRTSLPYQPRLDVDVNLAALFNNFGGAPTIVQMEPVDKTIPQHVIIDNRTDNQRTTIGNALSEPVPVYLTNAQVGTGGTVTPMGLTNAELRGAPLTVHVDNPVTSVGIAGPVAVTGGLTAEQLRSAPLAVQQSGPVAISGTVTTHADGPVAIAGTVPVSGPLTDDQLRAAPVPVTGAVTAHLDGPVVVAGTVAVSGPLTNQELRASRVPVDVAFPATQPVSLAAAPLPAGAATAQAQATIQAGIAAVAADIAQVKAQTASLDVALSTRTKPGDTQKVDGSGVTQPVSAAALPLPAGAATEATLALIRAALAAPPLPAGAATAALQASLGSVVATEATLQLLRALLTTGNGYLQTLAAATPGPKVTGGTVTATVLSAAGTNANSLKSSAGQVYSVSAHNSSSSWRYVQLFNTATAPPAGAAPALVVGIPPNSARDVQFAFGAPFSAGIGYTITAKAGLLDLLSVVLAGEVGVNIAFA